MKDHEFEREDLADLLIKEVSVKQGTALNKYHIDGILLSREVLFMKQSTYEYWMRIIEDQRKSGCGVKPIVQNMVFQQRASMPQEERLTPKDQM